MPVQLPPNPQESRMLVLKLAKATTGKAVEYEVNGEKRKLVEVAKPTKDK